MLDFTFLFLDMRFEFGPETFRGCSHIPYEHSHFSPKFFVIFKNGFLNLEHREYDKDGNT